MGQMIGYGTITSNGNKQVIKKKSAAFLRLRSMFLPEDNIEIEIVKTPDDNRPLLCNLIEDKLSDNDIIVIESLKTLGTKSTIPKWYKAIADKGIGLLIPDYNNKETGLDKYSTANWGFEKLGVDIDKVIGELNDLKYIAEKTGKGRIKKEIDDTFVAAYWAWQNYFISTEKALACSKLSRQSFYKMTRDYENTEEYIDMLAKQPQNFVEKPKRGTLPEIEILRELLFEVVNNRYGFAEACSIYHKNHPETPEDCLKIPEIEFQRMMLTYLNGKKAMAEAQKLYKDKDFKLQKGPSDII